MIEPGADTNAPAGATVDPDTGFDLIVDPAGVMVKLDGKSIGKAPLQIRNLAPGDHFVEIEAPAGFYNKTHSVKVTQGVADRVVIRLDPMEIVGQFTSEPPSATVTLVADGEKIPLGRTPTKAKLDPRKRYEVVFKKENYVTVTRPIEISGGPEVPVAVVLERAKAVAADDSTDSSAAAVARDRDRDRTPARDRERDRTVARTQPREPAGTSEGRPTSEERAPAGAAEEERMGVLQISSKPPCQIFIGGRNTGKMTPQREIRLRAGNHEVTLVNSEFGIKERFTVKIAPGKPTRVIQDMTDRIK